jgi:putative transposase
MLKAYKYRIYPNVSQRQALAHHFGCARWVYNWALAKTKDHYDATKKQLSRRDLQDSLVALKHTEEHAWLKDVNSQSLLGSLLHLHKAYKNFFKKRAKYPRFKKKHNRQTFECPQHVTLDIENRFLNLPKIKSIKIKQHRTFEGKIKTVTLTKTPSEKYYASILVENTDTYPSSLAVQEENTLGIDLGLTHFSITSKGVKVPHPKYLKESLKRLAVAQKVRSRKDYKNKSNNYKKQCIRVAKIHERVASRRYDFIQQYTARLVRENQINSFAVEDLHVKGMIRNRKLSRAIADSAWGNFLRVLSYKSKWHGKNVLPIGRFIASSKTCHACGHKTEKLPLSVREWGCICGLVHDRDINAAKVIKKQAITDALGQSACIKSSSATIPVSAGVAARG